jgi:hypothetical protein
MEKRPMVVQSGATEVLRVTRQKMTRSGVKNREDRPVWKRKNAKAPFPQKVQIIQISTDYTKIPE